MLSCFEVGEFRIVSGLPVLADYHAHKVAARLLATSLAWLAMRLCAFGRNFKPPS